MDILPAVHPMSMYTSWASQSPEWLANYTGRHLWTGVRRDPQREAAICPSALPMFGCSYSTPSCWRTAEIFAIDFDPKAVPNLLEGWRPDNPEEAVLSACSTLITIIKDFGSKNVQFFHFSVKEFFIPHSSRCRLHCSRAGTPYCTATLDGNVDKKCLATFPLAFYAAEH